jgi:hypothetical protein
MGTADIFAIVDLPQYLEEASVDAMILDSEESDAEWNGEEGDERNHGAEDVGRHHQK